MKIRVKFAKEGPMKFIGHLDVMRFFQKAIARAGLPAAYSEGFSPHMLLSFAAPLGVGITSAGEYFDLTLREEMDVREAADRLNAVMCGGMRVLCAVRVPEGKAGKAMSLVAAADYLVRIRPGCEPSFSMPEAVNAFLKRKEILILRKTKRSERMTDIRPWIYRMEWTGEGIRMRLAQGSEANLKPELVMEALYRDELEPVPDFAFLIHREETYASVGEGKEQRFVPLCALGEEET